MWLRNSWYVAGFANEIGERPLARRILGDSVLLYRLSDGKAVALQNRCPHRLVPLSLGQRVGDEIQCRYHGLKFAGDGRCTFIPGQSVIPPNARAVSFPLVERHGLAWIWIGRAELASETAIPDLPWLGDPHWRQSPGYHHFECDYRLMTDNLLDLSHETYVHRHTIGNQAAQSIADFPVEITVEDGVIIRVHREMPGIDPPPFFAMILKSSQPIDRWQTAIYMPPGVHMTEAGVHLSGCPRSTASVSRVMHLLTPESANATHYFWTVARNYHITDQDMTAAIAKSIATTFDEDKEVLELQQKVLDQAPDESLPRFAVKLDDAPLRARRILTRLLREQASDAHSKPPVRALVPDESGTPAMRAAV